MKHFRYLTALSAILFLAACAPSNGTPDTAPIDLIQPATGDTSLVSQKVKELGISWTSGSDNVTISTNLEYAVYISTSDNISTLTEAQSNGTPVLAWTKNHTSVAIGGLAGDTNYYVGVFVRDEAGNINRYPTFNAKTLIGVTITWCDIQYPSSISASVESSTTVFAQYYATGVTTTGTAAPAVLAQCGWYPRSGSISLAQYVNASFVQPIGNNHEYQADLVIGTSGSYNYFFRFSGDCGATWTYTTAKIATISN
jgi:hypothetical protein